MPLNPNNIELETYQGKASPHDVMVKHINQVLAAEHRHMMDYHQERAQIAAERRARHEQEYVQTDSSIPMPITATHTQDADMNLKQIAATALTIGSLAAVTATTTACGEDKGLAQSNTVTKIYENGDGFDITKNPNAKQAYKLKVKVKDAPGKLQFAQGDVTFGIKNIKNCGYIVEALQETTTQVHRTLNFPLLQINDTEYEGIFYTDWGQDGDFFGKGVCHWFFESVGASLSATGADGEARFGPVFEIDGTNDERFGLNTSLTRFYIGENYPISRFWNSGTAKNELHTLKPELLNHLFSITIIVEETK